ncbi:MAG: hypothetical protein HKN89_00030, partial [Eudoraea sp.]|nr:hypothetical protein [Eudoraea sp.]
MYRYFFTLLLALCISLPVTAQKKKKKDKKEESKEWSVANPGESFKYTPHSFTTDEGTWMNLDVSPD